MPVIPLRIIGPFTVNWNDPGVSVAGTTIWTPGIGEVVYDIWWEMIIAMAGSGGWSATTLQLLAGAQTVMSGVAQGQPAATGATFRASTQALSTSDSGPSSAFGANPMRFIAANPVKAKLTPDVGAMTAGQLAFYALVNN